MTRGSTAIIVMVIIVAAGVAAGAALPFYAAGVQRERSAPAGGVTR